MYTETLINKYLTGFFILAIGAFLFYGLQEFFSAFLGSIIFYILFRKFMIYLTFRKNFKKPLAAIIIILISFIIVVLPMGILISMIMKRVMAIMSNPDQVKSYVDKLSAKLDQLPFDVSTGNLGEKAAAFASAHAGDVINSSFSIGASLLMMYFLLYFLLMHVKALEKKMTHYLPFENDKIRLFGKELVDQTYGNAIGVPAVAAAQGLAAYGAFLIADVPDSGLLAILTGFASIIPLVGTAVVWVPVAAYLFASDMIWQGVFVTVFCVVIMTNLDNLVRMIVSKRIGDVHPITTVLGVIFGLKFFGLPGLVFGPLLISYFLLLLKIYHVEYNVKTELAEEEQLVQEENAMMRMLSRILFFTDNFRKENENPNPQNPLL